MIDAVFNRVVELLTSEQLVFYIGPDLNESLTGAPGWPELAQRLAERGGYDTANEWPQVAARYEGQFAKQDLIDWLVNQLSGKRPGPLNEALAALPVRTYISAAYDDLLQQALDSAGRPVNSIVEDKDLNFIKAGRSTVVKLFGEVEVGRERWSSLLMTSAEIRSLLQYRDSILKQQVFPHFSGRTVLIIGQELNAGFFQNLYYQSLPQDSPLRRRAYAVCEELEDWERERWANSQLTIIEAEPLVFLQQLLAATRSLMGSVTPVEPPGAIRVVDPPSSGKDTYAQKELTEVTNRLLSALRDVFAEKFNDEELRDFCFELGIEYESLPVGGKRTKARELASYLDRHNRILDLVPVGERVRSDIPWRQILSQHGVAVESPDPDVKQDIEPPSVAPADLRKITRILADVPDFATPEGRDVIMNLSGVSDIVEGIDLNGARRTVAGQLIIRLSEYGAFESGGSALGNLLKYMISQPDLPPSSKKQIEEIIDTYHLTANIISQPNGG